MQYPTKERELDHAPSDANLREREVGDSELLHFATRGDPPLHFPENPTIPATVVDTPELFSELFPASQNRTASHVKHEPNILVVGRRKDRGGFEILLKVGDVDFPIHTGSTCHVGIGCSHSVSRSTNLPREFIDYLASLRELLRSPFWLGWIDYFITWRKEHQDDLSWSYKKKYGLAHPHCADPGVPQKDGNIPRNDLSRLTCSEPYCCWLLSFNQHANVDFKQYLFSLFDPCASCYDFVSAVRGDLTFVSLKRYNESPLSKRRPPNKFCWWYVW
jgi:hypothetical protein